MLKAHPLAKKFDFIRSEKTLYEILPKGIGKGVSIINLCKHLNIDVDKTIAIGDYNNDISMFEAAEIGIAVSFRHLHLLLMIIHDLKIVYNVKQK